MTVDWAAVDALGSAGSAVGTLLIGLVGYRVTQRQNRSAELQRSRLAHYDALAPHLNRIMCYLSFIGQWRDQTPLAVLDAKRALDQRFHIAKPLFDESVARAYDDFMGLCFMTFGRFGEDARIRSDARLYASAYPSDQDWKASWSNLFEPPGSNHPAHVQAVRAAYDRLVAALMADIDLAPRRATARYTTDRLPDGWDPASGAIPELKAFGD